MKILLKKTGEITLPTEILQAMEITKDCILEGFLENGRLLLAPAEKKGGKKRFISNVLKNLLCV